MHEKRVWAALLTTMFLAGCGTLTNGAPLAHQTKGKVGAKSLSPTDVQAVFEAAAKRGEGAMRAGLPAVTAAPTEVVAQRYLQRLFTNVAQATVEIDPAVDQAMGEQTFALVAKQGEITDQPEVLAYMQGVADRMSTAANQPTFKVHLVNSPNANAFNAGGTSMVIYTGILGIIRDEAEFAGLMAHEMGHGLQRHIPQKKLQRMAAESAEDWGSTTYPAPKSELDLITAYRQTLPPSLSGDFDFLLSFLQGKVGPAAMTQAKLGVNGLFALKALERITEDEADVTSIRMLNAAGYDTYATATLFDRLNQQPDRDPRYEDHPALGERVASMRARIKAEGLTNDRMDRGADRFAAMLRKFSPKGPSAARLPSDVASIVCF